MLGTDPAPSAAKPAEPVAGSAFFVASDGTAITNAHVVTKCREVTDRVTNAKGRVAAVDLANDLALLNFPPQPRQSVSIMRRTSPPQLGEEVLVFGFPLTGLLSPSGVATTGSVSATEGPGGTCVSSRSAPRCKAATVAGQFWTGQVAS